YGVLRAPAHPPTSRRRGLCRRAPGGGGGEGDDPDDDLSPQTVALRALKEIEFDRATGKLSDADYDALKAKYTGAALVALRGETPGSVASEAPTHPASRIPYPVCPADGPRPEVDAAFCSSCGRRLGSALGYCARCGTSLPAAARYCERCGNRVAA
ncbi:MAG: double zinc ribbon domain-containing protein, partial [Gemmatimonadales bacterium]